MYLEIDEGYPGHRKTLRLCALLKCDTADAYPPRLWAWAARSAPDGDLTGMDAAELEMALRWRGNEGALFAALIAAGFVDQGCINGPTSIHNWAERTGGAIEKMAARAGMAKERRQHMDGKCSRACRYCNGTLTVRSQARSHQDKTSQDQSSDLPPFASRSKPPERAPERSESRANWAASDWHKRFGKAWVEKYGGLAMGGGTAAAKATGELHDMLAELPTSDRAAAETRADVMIADYLGSEKPDLVDARHPWSWFVVRWDSLRKPRLAVAKPAATESFVERDARLARESAEKTAREVDATVRATDQHLAKTRIDPSRLPTRAELDALRVDKSTTAPGSTQ